MCQIDGLGTGSTFLRKTLFYEKISLFTLFYWFSKISTLSKHIVPRNLHLRSNEIFVRKNLIKVNLFFNKYCLIDEFQCFH